MPHARMPFNQFFSSNGDGTGIVNQAGNYSATPQLFRIEAQPNQQIILSHVHYVIISSTNMLVADYGSIAGGLINGVKVEAKLDGVVSDFLKGFRIKINGDLLGIVETEITTYAGTGQAILGTVFFSTSYDGTLTLNPGEYMGVVVNDNLTALVRQYVVGWGQILDLSN